MLAAGDEPTIPLAEADLRLPANVLQSFRQVVDALFDFYDARGFEQSATEREKLLYL